MLTLHVQCQRSNSIVFLIFPFARAAGGAALSPTPAPACPVAR